MSRATLSVVLPNYNHGRYVGRVIETIVSQTRPPDELIVLDDGSTDDSVAVIESWAARYPALRFVRNEKNAGVFAAHQRLFDLAAGDYLYPASADDDLRPQFFERALEMAERYPQAGLVFGEAAIWDERDREVDRIVVRRWREPTYAAPERFLCDYLEVEEPSHSITTSTVFKRRSLAAVGWLRAELGSWSDTFAIRAIGLKEGVAYVPETFSTWRRLPGSVSGVARRDPQYLLDLVARAAYLMRQPEFRELFPESHVRRWTRRYRMRVIKDYLRGDLTRVNAGPLGLARLSARCLRRGFGALLLARYRGDVSPCLPR